MATGILTVNLSCNTSASTPFCLNRPLVTAPMWPTGWLPWVVCAPHKCICIGIKAKQNIICLSLLVARHVHVDGKTILYNVIIHLTINPNFVSEAAFHLLHGLLGLCEPGSAPSRHRCPHSALQSMSLLPLPWPGTEWSAGPRSSQRSPAWVSRHSHTRSRTEQRESSLFRWLWQ